MNTQYIGRRYRIQAKRNHKDAEWTDWTLTNDYGEAVRQIDIIRSLGFFGRIVDQIGIVDIAKMIETEYEKAKKLDYVKNKMAFALYAVWKKIDKDGKKR